MKKKVKYFVMSAVIFLAGGLCGVVFTSILFHRNALSPLYNNALIDIAVDAQQLSQGKAEEVLKRKVMSIPSITQSYYGHYYKYMPKDNSRYAGLWQVQKYYQISGNTIPTQIKPILESLPERPLTSCELKRIKDSNSIETNDVQ